MLLNISAIVPHLCDFRALLSIPALSFMSCICHTNHMVLAVSRIIDDMGIVKAWL